MGVKHEQESEFLIGTQEGRGGGGNILRGISIRATAKQWKKQSKRKKAIQNHQYTSEPPPTRQHPIENLFFFFRNHHGLFFFPERAL